MRKIILAVAASLDGLIEGQLGEYDWCFTDQDYGMQSFLDSIDTIIMGRKSFEVAGANPFPEKKCYVFSRNSLQQLPGIDWIQGDAATRVTEIKSIPGKDIWLFGGAALANDLLKQQLVDEIWISIHPIILGSGKPLFASLPGRIQLELKESIAYSSGLVSVSYQVLYKENALL